MHNRYGCCTTDLVPRRMAKQLAGGRPRKDADDAGDADDFDDFDDAVNSDVVDNGVQERSVIG
jgi:hypothetical protein